MELDEHNVNAYNIYLLVRNQVRITPMGDTIDLDYAAVLGVIKLYVADEKVKATFERVVNCYQIEREFLQ